MIAWLKDKALLAYAIVTALWEQHNEPPASTPPPLPPEDNTLPLPPIIPPEGLAMRWREELPTKPEVKHKPLSGSLADRLEKARSNR